MKKSRTFVWRFGFFVITLLSYIMITDERQENTWSILYQDKPV